MPPVAFDTETELIGPGNQAPHLICLSWTSVIGQEQIVHWRDARKVAKELIESATRESPLVGHNVAFDLCLIARQFPDLVGSIFDAYSRDAVADTFVREKLIDIAKGYEPLKQKRPYALATLARKYVGEELDKDTWRLRYGEFKEVPLAQWPEGAKHYATTDAKTTLQVFAAQQDVAGSDMWLFLDAPAQCRADFALRLASNRGLVTSSEAVQKFCEQIKDEFAQVKSKLIVGGLLKPAKKAGETVYVRNTKKAQERLANALGSNVEKTPTGLIQVDEDSCKASNDGLLIAYNRFTKLQTLITKDCQILERGAREPIHTSFNVLVNTGRTSSRNPNMQNPRREPGVRECFVPRPGYVFASADYEAAELHTLAQVCISLVGWSKLARYLNDGIDPHLALAALLLRISYDDAVSRRKAGNKQVAEARQMAKAANFGFPGGMGPRAFRQYVKGYGFNLSLDAAAELRKSWLENLPEMNEYFRYIRKLLGRAETTNICHLVTRRRRGLVNYTAACNSFFQGLAADGAKRALFEVQRHCYAKPESPLYGSHIVNFLHDEILIETPEDKAPEAATQLAEVMVAEFNHFVPDVPVRAAPQLARCWSKDAKAMFDETGRLIPWNKVPEKGEES